MMCCFSCPICLNEYSSEVSPRVLPCGHTCCKLCLSKILTNQKTCFTCRKDLSKTETGKYPVNYEILKGAEALSNYSRSYYSLRCRIQSNINRHESVLNEASRYLTDRKEFMTKIENLITEMKSNEVALNEFLTTEEANLNLDVVCQQLAAIERVMDETKTAIDSKSNITSRIDFHSSQFGNSMQFLEKIFQETYQRRFIFACKIIDGVEKFAKIDISNNRLLLHALDSTNKNESSKHVEFQDIRDAILNHGFCAFLSFKPIKGIIKTFFINCNCNSKSILTHNFLRLCSGENGVSYLRRSTGVGMPEAASLNINTLVTVTIDEKLEMKNKYSQCASKIISSHSCSCSYYKDKVCVQMVNPIGSFEIYRSIYHEPGIIGIVTNVQDALPFQIDLNQKVLECGLTVSL